ncbi:CBO0543 family protein [Neobacillus terrae]|uniref:CBO0543 family protein n=1 Tax=Neobacillus terrae TaxID=3034837 RepID=UPI00140C0A62|nr:CBO0543 family protein [Neobacillus terrae]NHM30763.1 hypothetical protein [Neobacillus terrae]
MSYPSFDKIHSKHTELEKMENQYWQNHDLFSFQWWLLLLVLIVPWIIWVKFVDRKRIKEILLFGVLLIILIGLMDDIGVNLSLWSYPYKLTYLVSRLSAVDYGMIVVMHMFIYQKFKKWKSFLIANAVLAAIFAFIFEPISVRLGIYKLDNWKYIYSFPIYILKASLVKWIIDKCLEKMKRTE